VWDNGGVRLLLVEDDGALARVLLRGLREEGYAVDHAGTCAAANELLDLNPYQLVILDLGLPDGDGLSLCAARRAAGMTTAVLMLTARDGVGSTVAGLDAGADDYLTKPFAYPELAARVRALLRRPAEAVSPVLTHGAIRLDTAAHSVWRDDVAGAVLVPLTPREFALLEHLMRRPGEVCRREHLLEQVWDTNYDGLSNVVDVHIANLRRKLAGDSDRVLAGGQGVDDDEPDLIETVRGVGYRWPEAS